MVDRKLQEDEVPVFGAVYKSSHRKPTAYFSVTWVYTTEEGGVRVVGTLVTSDRVVEVKEFSLETIHRRYPYIMFNGFRTPSE